MSENRRCSNCGSDQVERLFMIWIDANTLESCGDYGPVKEGPGKYWCRACETNPDNIDGLEACDV